MNKEQIKEILIDVKLGKKYVSNIINKLEFQHIFRDEFLEQLLYYSNDSEKLKQNLEFLFIDVNDFGNKCLFVKYCDNEKLQIHSCGIAVQNIFKTSDITPCLTPRRTN